MGVKMMKRLPLLLILLVGCAKPVPAPAPVAPPPEKKLLVYVSGPVCPACVKMEGTFKDDRVQKRLADFNFIKVQGREADRKYKVSSYPTYVLVGMGGSVLKRGVGYRTPEEFLTWLGN
jgi:thioredoxin-related protein